MFTLLFYTQKPVDNQRREYGKQRKTCNGEAGINTARHQDREAQKLARLYKAFKRPHRKGKIDKKIHPVYIGIRHESISAISVYDTDHDTKIIGNVLKELFRKPSACKSNRHHLKEHDDTACVRYLPIPEDEE